MAYEVIARKWRPQTFEEIVGQETVTRTLRNALRSGRVAHAFLFSGVRGVGKTTAARILAKALNCHEGVGADPCGECVSCEEIKAGNSVDVQEIDAASNRGIDSIRELRESVRYGTARDRFKIFIVDEVHMLTNEAFNALLKTLEEPPDHVKFILATTEYHKIPTTITSRCQKYEFRPIPFSGILERLRLICESEGVKISDYALSAVSSAAQGGMRDAQSALDQIIAFSGKEILDDDVRALLGIVDQEVVSAVVAGVLSRNRGELIEALHTVLAGGISPQVLCAKLVEYTRALLIFKSVGWNESLLQLPDSSREVVEKQAGEVSEIDLLRFYDLLHRTANELRWHSQPAVHLEMALLKLVELTNLPRIEEVIGRLESGSPVQLPAAEKAKASSASAPSLESGRREIGFRSNAPGESPPLPEQGQGRPQSVPPPATGSDVDRLMATLQSNFAGLYHQLQCASNISYSEGRLKINFPAAEKFHATVIEGPDNRKRLSETLATIVGGEAEIDITVEEETQPEEAGDPMQDPKVREFIKRYPGRVFVKRDLEED